MVGGQRDDSWHPANGFSTELTYHNYQSQELIDSVQIHVKFWKDVGVDVKVVPQSGGRVTDLSALNTSPPMSLYQQARADRDDGGWALYRIASVDAPDQRSRSLGARRGHAVGTSLRDSVRHPPGQQPKTVPTSANSAVINV